MPRSTTSPRVLWQPAWCSSCERSHCSGDTSSTSTGQVPDITATATCADLAGNIGAATYPADVGKTAPSVAPSTSPVATTSGRNNTHETMVWN